MKILLAAGSLMLTAGSLSGSDLSPANQVLEAYSNVQYPRARKLAQKYSKLPESRLVLALCAVFDRKKQDIDYGIPELKKIYDDQSIPAKYRLQAGLAYARAAQTLGMRGHYPIVDGIDYDKVYDEIIKQFPDRPETCFAVFYKTSELLNSDVSDDHSEGIQILEKFTADFKGDKTYLAAIYIQLANQYIWNGKNYEKSIKNFVSALHVGIVNPRNREGILYQIGRMYDTKLHNKVLAKKYYMQFVKEYPNSSNEPVVRRFLREMDAENQKGGK